ncbi:uncharacterized protein BDV14DRAFT_172972 [Aspergillus stella-maris]|uniref:uncharacterized protein n=1 Tax=Aspergillus stella-maris TaxID=1810926 RepID=UPI003CCD4B00
MHSRLRSLRQPRICDLRTSLSGYRVGIGMWLIIALIDLDHGRFRMLVLPHPCLPVEPEWLAETFLTASNEHGPCLSQRSKGCDF